MLPDTTQTIDHDAQPSPLQPFPEEYDPNAIFHENGPIEPTFINEAIRALIRATPLEDPSEPREWAYRRMYAATRALAALHPSDEIEVMLGVQAVSAYHAAATSWYLGMNLCQPSGNSPRHFATAASAARTFDTMLKALERRQARKPVVRAGHTPQQWSTPDIAGLIKRFEVRCADRPPIGDSATERVEWSTEDQAIAAALIEQDRHEQENAGLDLTNTEGIRPDGSIIMPADPTPQQADYIARRLGLACKRESAENLRRGIRKHPPIRPLRTGDLVP